MQKIRNPDNKNMIKQYVIPKYTLSVVSCLIFIIFTTSGYTGEYANFVSLGLCLIWFGISFISNYKVFISIFLEKKTIALLIFFLFYLVTSLPTAGVYNTFKYMGSFIILFSPMFIYSYYQRLGNIKLLKKLLYFTYIIWLFFVIKALHFYYLNPNAARRLASNKEYYGVIAIGGGYSLAIASTILAVFLMVLVLNKLRKGGRSTRLSKLIFIVLLILVVFETRSTITFLGLILGLFLTLLLNLFSDKAGKIKINYRIIFLSSLFLIIILIAFINTNNIGYLMMILTQNSTNKLFIRLHEIGIELYNFRSKGGSTYLRSRLSLLLESLKLFISSPFIGNGFKYAYDFNLSKLIGIGNHSEWLDILAIYGLFGGLPIFMIYYYGIQTALRYHCSVSMGAYIFVLIFLGLFNPFKSFQAHLIIFFVIPATLYIYKKNCSIR